MTKISNNWSTSSTGKIILSGSSESSASASGVTVMSQDVTRPKSVHKNINNLKHHAPQSSQLLMRAGVKKPAEKAQATSSASTAPAKTPMSATNADYIDRLSRATSIDRSENISHFTPSSVAAESTSYQAPTPQPTVTVAARPKTTAVNNTAKPVVAAAPAKPDIFERAIAAAEPNVYRPDRNKKKHRSYRKKIGVTFASILVAGLIFGGVQYGGKEVNAIRFHIASDKAGFRASEPTYLPSGYSLKQFNYGNKVVSVSYTSNSDGRSYKVIQEKSSWNDQNLIDDYVEPIDPNYQTNEATKLTVYLYGNHNASWLNNGVWYVIQSNGALSDSQLVTLANSL